MLGLLGGIRHADVFLPDQADALTLSVIPGPEILIQKSLKQFPVVLEEMDREVVELLRHLHQCPVFS